MKLISQPDETSELEITFWQLRYTGQDQLLLFDLQQAGEVPNKETYRVTIKQAEADLSTPEAPISKLIPAPRIIYRLKTDPGELVGGSTKDVILVLENVGLTAITRPVLRLQASDDLSVASVSGSRLLPDILASETQEVKLSLQVADQPKSQKQYLELEVGFVYDSSQGSVLAGSKDRLELMVMSESKESADPIDPPVDDIYIPAGDDKAAVSDGPVIDSAVPNVLVKQFRYGDKAVAAGEAFELVLDIVNTSSKLAVENIVMSLEPGENFAIDASTNVYHFATLGVEGSLSQTLKLKALPGAKTGSDAIEISFRYEYLEHDKRSQANMTQKLAIPIYQPDRFEISPPDLPEELQVGEEAILNLTYVNKGKSEVSNVEAMIEGEVVSVNKHQNLGNFEPGKSGTISFIINPVVSGPLDLNLKIQYEDGNQDTKMKQFPVKLSVSEPSVPEDLEPELDGLAPETEATGRRWLMGIGAIGLIAISVILWRRRHHQAEDTAEWDEV